MSLVTDVVVTVAYASRELHDALIAPMEFDDPRHQNLTKIDMQYAGGHKVFQSDVYAAGLNYVSGTELEEWFKALPWHRQDNAVLVWNTEGDSFGRVVIGGVMDKNWVDRDYGWGH